MIHGRSEMMASLEYVKAGKLDLKKHSEFSERWVQQRIAEDPSLLGLGDVILKDQERAQPGAGRLDLLFQDPDASLRYEVEVQLGPTDESHIVRTIEYWDIERKRYPQYDHVAVLVAEDVTSRFLNVISLLNGAIPLVAIQLNAIKIDDKVTLISTTVLDQRTAGLAVEDEEEQEVTDRAYWEKRGTPATVKLADQILEIARSFDQSLQIKYNKFYMGITKDGQPLNFVICRAQKQALRVEPRLKRDEDIEAKLEDAGLDVMEYSSRTGRYRIRLTKGDVDKHRDLLAEILGQAFERWVG
jgi:hypothetical protein